MSITRRQTLQIAATLAASRASLFAVTPAQAAALLDGAAADDDFPQLVPEMPPCEHDMVDPITFAIELDSTGSGWGSGFTNGASMEWAEYKQALDVVIALDPALLRAGAGQPVTLLDEAVGAMGSAMWRAGVVAGAAYEHLRLALSAPLVICLCNGHGCEACDGKGTVPAEAPRMTFGAD